MLQTQSDLVAYIKSTRCSKKKCFTKNSVFYVYKNYFDNQLMLVHATMYSCIRFILDLNVHYTYVAAVLNLCTRFNYIKTM